MKNAKKRKKNTKRNVNKIIQCRRLASLGGSRNQFKLIWEITTTSVLPMQLVRKLLLNCGPSINSKPYVHTLRTILMKYFRKFSPQSRHLRSSKKQWLALSNHSFNADFRISVYLPVHRDTCLPNSMLSKQTGHLVARILSKTVNLKIKRHDWSGETLSQVIVFSHLTQQYPFILTLCYLWGMLWCIRSLGLCVAVLGVDTLRFVPRVAERAVPGLGWRLGDCWRAERTASDWLDRGTVAPGVMLHWAFQWVTVKNMANLDW